MLCHSTRELVMSGITHQQSNSEWSAQLQLVSWLGYHYIGSFKPRYCSPGKQETNAKCLAQTIVCLQHETAVAE